MNDHIQVEVTIMGQSKLNIQWPKQNTLVKHRHEPGSMLKRQIYSFYNLLAHYFRYA